MPRAENTSHRVGYDVHIFFVISLSFAKFMEESFKFHSNTNVHNNAIQNRMNRASNRC